MAEIEDNIRRSEELNEILGKMPNWVIRYGSVVVFFIFIVLVVSTFVIQYPDTLSGNITITCETPPANLVARTGGRITLLTKDGKPVKEGDFIAVIENTTSEKEVEVLRGNLPAYELIAEDPIALISEKINLPNSVNLGEIQPSYNSFKNASEEYILFLQLKLNQSKIVAYKKQIDVLYKQRALLTKKETISNRELQLSHNQLKNDSVLFIKKAISKLDLDKTESNYIKSVNANHQIQEDILRNAEALHKLNALIDELFLSSKDEKSKLEMKLKTAFKDLKTNYKLWEQKYVITAPTDGTVSLYEYWNNNQVVSQGDEVAHIVTNADNIFGKLYITGAKFGKVKKGQRVRIILDNYPAPEFGAIIGKVESISAVNKENVYAINVTLPEGLVTNYKFKIDFTHEMKGSGEVVTEELSLIERIFYKFRELFVKEPHFKKVVSNQ